MVFGSRRRATRKRSDSGSASSGNQANAARAPPVANIARQPPSSISAGAAKPDMAAPREIPQAIRATSTVRLARRGEFGAERQCVGQARAQPYTGEEAPCEELVWCVRGCSQQRGNTHQREGAEQYRAPPEIVSEGTDYESRCRDADERCGDDPAQLARGHMPVCGEARCCGGHRLDVEAVEEGDQRAQDQDTPMQGAEPGGRP